MSFVDIPAKELMVAMTLLGNENVYAHAYMTTTKVRGNAEKMESFNIKIDCIPETKDDQQPVLRIFPTGKFVLDFCNHSMEYAYVPEEEKLISYKKGLEEAAFLRKEEVFEYIISMALIKYGNESLKTKYWGITGW